MQIDVAHVDIRQTYLAKPKYSIIDMQRDISPIQFMKLISVIPKGMNAMMAPAGASILSLTLFFIRQTILHEGFARVALHLFSLGFCVAVFHTLLLRSHGFAFFIHACRR